MTLSLRTIRGDGCTPRLAIVAPTAAICSGVARSRSCPIEAAPTARSSLRSFGNMLVTAPGTRGGALKPKRSAAASIFLRPSLAPSGANTELQETVNACDERAAARLVAGVAQLDARQHRVLAHRIACSTAVAILFWSAADSVTILNVEPGGWAPSIESPLSASTEPSRGFSTAMPPRRSPSAATAARCRLGRIVARTERPRRALVAAIRRLPNSSTALGRPASRSL